MTASRLSRVITICAVLAVPACDTGLTSPRVILDVHTFVESEPVESAQNVEILHEDPATGIVLFAVRNGPPQDCPSGCFVDRALGLRAEDRFGWWDPPFGTGPWTTFDVRATDASLFDPAALSRIKAELDALTFWSFANFVACDPDTPSATRERLAAETGDGLFPRCSQGP